LRFESFEHTLGFSRSVKPIITGVFAAGEVPKGTELWPINLVVEANPCDNTAWQNKHKIAWQIILGVKNEQDRRKWEVHLSLCDGAWN
jgi:hypothetical protein